VEDWSAAWLGAAGHLDEALAVLAAQVQAVDPLNALRQVAADLEQDAARLEQAAARGKQAWQAGQQEVQSARERLRLLDEAQAQELAWWKGVYAALPERLRSAALAAAATAGSQAAAPTQAAPESLETVEAMLAASNQWQAELAGQQAYLKRAEGLVTDWVQRLRANNPRDKDDLKQIYIDNANVIGITCVQAGGYQFSRAYRNFDCVIIDEVSKATPPELLLPMLKGARVVLVGDHKQLPPMIGPETMADLAIEMEVPKAELDHLERSLFKELFEGAPPELKVMLTEQYRMHPQIMEAINQFYDGKLEAGLLEPDKARAHGLDLPWLRPDNHLLWINTPTEGPFVEQKIGTTFMNAGEIDVILRLVKALDAAWAPLVAAGQPPKEVGVITFYGAQVRELKARLVERTGQYKNLRLRVGTVDRFQGMERPIIIVSLVRNNDFGSVGFARKPERVNVAFSRAQELLVIVGSRELFTERARDVGPGEGQVRAMYGRVAEVVSKAGGLRRTTDVSNDFKR
jgi:AAA domain